MLHYMVLNESYQCSLLHGKIILKPKDDIFYGYGYDAWYCILSGLESFLKVGVDLDLCLSAHRTFLNHCYFSGATQA